MKVTWKRQALADRDAAIAYIRQFNPQAARRLLHELIDIAGKLSDFPDRGRPGDIAGTREIVVVRPYVLVYEVDHAAKRVTILRLWHAAQDR